MVWAEVSPSAVLGIEDQAPILDRQPIHADDQNCSDVLTFGSNCPIGSDGLRRALFGPIPVPREPLDPRLLLDRLGPRGTAAQPQAGEVKRRRGAAVARPYR